jgi:tol-pal system protein YbgF
MKREHHVRPGRVRRLLCAGLLGAALSSAALAQDYDRPPGDVPAAGDAQSEAGALALRIDRLEAALRRANGQIEELQNDNRKLADQLRRFREDVEFRLGNKQGQAEPEPGPTVVATQEPIKETQKPLRKPSDAFDPLAHPDAPGAPRQMGTTPPSAPLVLGSHVTEKPEDQTLPPPYKPAPKAGDDSPPNFVPSGVPFNDAKEQFKSAVAAYKAGQYADAEALLKAYIAANAGASNIPDAVFYIGETYLQRSRPREAAEQYLKVSTDYAKSTRAPESMMRLGQALAMLGNKEQACATFAEVGKRYPTAPTALKKSIDREIQSHRCT